MGEPLTEEQLVEALAVDIYSACVIHTEGDEWLRYNPAPPTADDFYSLQIESEQEPWRVIARKLIKTYKEKSVTT